MNVDAWGCLYQPFLSFIIWEKQNAYRIIIIPRLNCVLFKSFIDDENYHLIP